jgi:hypothetical protein
MSTAIWNNNAGLFGGHSRLGGEQCAPSSCLILEILMRPKTTPTWRRPIHRLPKPVWPSSAFGLSLRECSSAEDGHGSWRKASFASSTRWNGVPLASILTLVATICWIAAGVVMVKTSIVREKMPARGKKLGIAFLLMVAAFSGCLFGLVTCGVR